MNKKFFWISIILGISSNSFCESPEIGIPGLAFSSQNRVSVGSNSLLRSNLLEGKGGSLSYSSSQLQSGVIYRFDFNKFVRISESPGGKIGEIISVEMILSNGETRSKLEDSIYSKLSSQWKLVDLSGTLISSLGLVLGEGIESIPREIGKPDLVVNTNGMAKYYYFNHMLARL